MSIDTSQCAAYAPHVRRTAISLHITPFHFIPFHSISLQKTTLSIKKNSIYKTLCTLFSLVLSFCFGKKSRVEGCINTGSVLVPSDPAIPRRPCEDLGSLRLIIGRIAKQAESSINVVTDLLFEGGYSKTSTTEFDQLFAMVA